MAKERVLANLTAYFTEVVGNPRSAREFPRTFTVERLITQTNNMSWSAFLRNYNAAAKRPLWERAFDGIVRDAAQADYVFVSLHLTFCVHGHFLSLLHLRPIEQLNPTHIVTLIDDVYDVWGRIKRRDLQDSTDFSLRLWQLMAWRSVETTAADLLARFLSERTGRLVPHYVVAVKHPTSVLHKLLFEPDATRFYLALPITNTLDSQQARSEIDTMRQEIHRRLLAFDPLTMDEHVPALFDEARQAGQTSVAYSVSNARFRWPFTDAGTLIQGADWSPVDIPATEILEVERIIQSAIPIRDYTLVDQANCLAVYRPAYGGRLSTGVMSEMNYASNSPSSPKDVLIYQPPRDGGLDHPFVAGYGVQYTVMDEWLKRLENYRPR